jgi:hypothetical protein
MKSLLLLSCVFFLLFSCKKEASSFCTEAMITWGGDPAADGLAGIYWQIASTTNFTYHKIFQIV